jgi:hypothetical protein
MGKSKSSRLAYYKRIFLAYLINKKSHLTFWHGKPEINDNVPINAIGEYYMPFLYKAHYQGPFDKEGIPMLDYKGRVSKQYNPIAIAQYGLGHYNLYKRTGDKSHFNIFLKQADWMVNNLENNIKGLYVWNHHFNWEYRKLLEAPWYSALSQGQGISLLIRAFKETKENKYLDASEKVFESFNYEISDGGVKHTDKNGFIWFEEVIIDPPTHILNGFLWALWGIYDYYLWTKDIRAKELFNRSIETLKENLKFFDAGFWSLYELSGTKLKMLASSFYHSLHIVQLRIMFKLTKEKTFENYADKWNEYKRKRLNRYLALVYKALFKLLYY